MLIILEGERPMSTNKPYAGMHWAKRKEEVDRVHMLVRAELDPDQLMLDFPVTIRITAYFDKYPLDSSNIFSKPYEDALIGRVIVDDGLKHVTQMATRARIDKKRPRVEILIRRDMGDDD